MTAKHLRLKLGEYKQENTELPEDWNSKHKTNEETK